MSEVKTQNIITPKATLSYPWLHQAQPVKEGDKGKPKFSGAFVFAKGTDLGEIKAAIIAVAQKKWPGKDIEKAFSTGALRNPLRYDGEEKGYPEGSIFFNARSERQPGTVYAYPGKNGKPEQIPQEKIQDELYAGALVRASITVFAYDNVGKGVGIALNNIQKLGEGERLDNRIAAENEFEADMSAKPADLSDLI